MLIFTLHTLAQTGIGVATPHLCGGQTHSKQLKVLKLFLEDYWGGGVKAPPGSTVPAYFYDRIYNNSKTFCMNLRFRSHVYIFCPSSD